MQHKSTFKKSIMSLLVSTVCTGTPAWADETVSPDYAAFVEAAAYVCTGTLFNDVPASHWACGYIEEFANLNITSGCGGGNFCPEDNVTRAQMAVFLVKGLEETLYDQLDGSGSGLDADLLDGRDSGYYLDWNNFVSVPADLLDGDNDTLAGLSCANGEVAKWNGSAWACAADNMGPNGDITAVNAGTGLSGGGGAGDVTLSADTTYLQRRVSSTCAAGSSIRAIAADGTVTCELDDNAGGDITAVIAGIGLNGGADHGDATLNVDVPLRLSGSSIGGIIRGTNIGNTTHAYGVEGYGNTAGGHFADANSSGYAYIGYGHYGIDARGNTAGGYFKDLNSSGYAYVGVGDTGISAQGNLRGGYFKDINSSGYADVGYGDYGIWASGNAAGGYFKEADASGQAYLGYTFLDGIDHEVGIWASGNSAGGYFKDANSSGYAYVGYGDHGIRAFGNTTGGYFSATNSSGYAYVGNGDYGIRAFGTAAGGYFSDSNSSSYAYVGYGAYKILGSGTVSFVQNHPENEDEVIVYAAPEGDEVATYTRGSARLVNGEARIPLGETFKWVTNPDIGLTAHLTPINGWAPLYVASKSTTELVVKSAPGYPDNVAFDYIVYGLRIGFEDITVVQRKTQEARIPSMADHRKAVAEHPELAQYTALSRFARMQGSSREAVKAQMVNAAALLEKIEEFDPKVHKIDGPKEMQ